MAISYYEKQGSLVNLMSGLQKRGWLIYGFNEDQSDSMTDYFHPASWDGIAVKNGYILVVDVYANGSIGGDFVQRSYDYKIAKRIQKLQTLADNHAASKGERANALTMIEKLDKSVIEDIIVQDDKPEVKYQKNPGNSKWHIERNGKIIAKGVGVFGFDNVNTWREEKVIYDDFEASKEFYPSYFNFTNEEDWKRNQEYRKEDKQKKIKMLDKYFALLGKWDKIATIKIGEGEEKMIEKTVIEIKTIYVAVESDKPTQYVAIGEKWRRACGLDQNKIYKLVDEKHVAKLTREWTKFYGKITVENMIGSKLYGSNDIATYKPEPRKNTKSSYFSGTKQDWLDGKFRYIELIPLENKIEKTVLVKQSSKKTPSKKKSTSKKEIKDLTESNLDFEALIQEGEIVEFEHTKTHEMLKVLKLATRLSKESFKEFNQYLKKNGIGYYSKYAKGFVLANENVQAA